MMIFHSYVSLPEGIHCFHIILTHWLGESWRASKNHVDWWGWNLQKRTFTNPWIPPWSLVEEVSASIVLSAQQHFFSLAWRCSPTKAGRFTKIGWDLNDQTPKTRGIWIHISANSIWDCHGLIGFSSLEVRVACRPSVCRFTGLSVFPAGHAIGQADFPAAPAWGYHLWPWMERPLGFTTERPLWWRCGTETWLALKTYA